MDLEDVLNEERQYQLKMKSMQWGRSMNSDDISFDRYYEHDEINKYLDRLASSHKNVEVKVIGKSYEGRDIKVIKITNGDGIKKKNSIFIDAGIHAREWIAPATALYIVQQLLNDESTARILNNLDIIVNPVVNPDGYQYTHKKERLWRKTRSKNIPGCIGTDGNRNFDFHWGEVGASPVPCMETYRGSKAFSEKETQALRDAVDEIKDTCKFYLTLHSYGNYMLYPWGYTSKLPDTWKDLDYIAQIGASAIKNATGTTYTVGSSTNVLYAAAGGSDDYMFAIFNVPISITMELPGGGQNGFDMPASKIDDTVKESAIGIFAMIEAVGQKYN
ncbi:carboxypeptidase B1-like [Chironomus tepperi]|uniref:carboxypeptidase B1-like n=1 Tax=Chironomus tepperi TaxID=113505 RepID=UPI00391F638D